jgi:hypothetical protein
MSAQSSSSSALQLTWRFACLEENISPKRPTRLPLLFAIDAKLQVPDGNTYDLQAIRQGAEEQNGSGGGCGGGCGGD